ncbi:MAG: hypothetical protein HN820_08555 [Candidatus Marinimicrobia bacterium]|nr:hypothetical protein [Candidatus Neomarinimicrobiota bacterium]MBT6871220.1 hypothetical protein [Candidatus Neomarinimicrobiota bacterium]MBT7378190.1 hypothetical protein [Candidatus Neomarinimicrobiota bacterium]
MERQAILYPLFMMVFLTFAVVYGQFYINLSALRKKDVRLSFFKLFKGDSDTPLYMEAARMHYRNMFEMPILFYVLVLFIYFSNNVTSVDVILAWLFVGGRIAHSLVRTFHYDDVPIRFKCFAFTVIILTIHWILVTIK